MFDTAEQIAVNSKLDERLHEVDIEKFEYMIALHEELLDEEEPEVMDALRLFKDTHDRGMRFFNKECINYKKALIVAYDILVKHGLIANPQDGNTNGDN